MIEQYGPVIIGVAALIGGTWLIIKTFLKTRLAKDAANNWPRASGKVIKSSKRMVNFGSPKSRNSKANSYVLDFEYQYEIGGREYHSSKPLFFGLYLFDEIERFLSKYPVGKEIIVYYDPKYPKRAVLETTLYGKNGVHEISFGVLLVVLAIIMFIIRFEVIYQWLNVRV